MAGIDNNTLLYLRGDSFADLSLGPMTLSMTSNSSTIYVQNNKLTFNSPGEDLKLITTNTIPGDFTFEWWCNIATIEGYNAFTNRATPGCFIISHRTESVDYLATWMGTAADNWNVVASHQFGVPTYNTDVHYAYVRKGDQYYTFVNGVLISQITAGALTLGLNNIGIGTGSRQTMWNIRISNVARWDSNFEPPTVPYTSVAVNILNQDDNSITFAATKQAPNETITKVDVLLNGTVINTYTSGYENTTCTIDNSLFATGANDIEVRAYYFENHYVSSRITQFRAIDKLGADPTLLEVINKLTEIKNIDASMNNRMTSFLVDRNVPVAENEKTITNLISKMQVYSSEAKNELTALINEIATLNNRIPEINNQIATLTGQVTSLNSTISSLNSQISSITSTNNTMKSNLVTAINKFGASATTSQSFSTILNNISTLYERAVTGRTYLTYSVSIPSGTPYGFVLNSNGFFESTNKGVDSSYALCSVYISNGCSFTIWIDYISYAENNYDYGLISKRGYTLSQSTSVDTANILINTKGMSSPNVQSVSLGTYSGGTIYVKYIKDSSQSSYNDSFQFRVRLGI